MSDINFNTDDYSEEQLNMEYEDWEFEEEFAKELLENLKENQDD